ncbi:hypothetical protein VP01_2548g1 [Puccinia sorghi]|uniref:Uncharacterized protein n=1 Tax=Puccinia sorghi TaxID=27349 RepID=A0A0L6V5C1_9BASI|nr:hypothetical protein VP01_2548g1 [Puccinia sorghi]
MSCFILVDGVVIEIHNVVVVLVSGIQSCIISLLFSFYRSTSPLCPSRDNPKAVPRLVPPGGRDLPPGWRWPGGISQGPICMKRKENGGGRQMAFLIEILRYKHTRQPNLNRFHCIGSISSFLIQVFLFLLTLNLSQVLIQSIYMFIAVFLLLLFVLLFFGFSVFHLFIYNFLINLRCGDPFALQCQNRIAQRRKLSYSNTHGERLYYYKRREVLYGYIITRGVSYIQWIGYSITRGGRLSCIQWTSGQGIAEGSMCGARMVWYYYVLQCWRSRRRGQRSKKLEQLKQSKEDWSSRPGKICITRSKYLGLLPRLFKWKTMWFVLLNKKPPKKMERGRVREKWGETGDGLSVRALWVGPRVILVVLVSSVLRFLFSLSSILEKGEPQIEYYSIWHATQTHYTLYLFSFKNLYERENERVEIFNLQGEEGSMGGEAQPNPGWKIVCV